MRCESENDESRQEEKAGKNGGGLNVWFCVIERTIGYTLHFHVFI